MEICLLRSVYLIVFLFISIMSVDLLSMVIQFEWTTLNPGAIPPRCRSLERKAFELLWPSKSSSQQSHMILNHSLTKEDCAHIVRWPAPLHRCSRTRRSCKVWCKPRANQNWLLQTKSQSELTFANQEPIRINTSILHLKIVSLYKRLVCPIFLRYHLAPPPFLSTSVLASKVNLSISIFIWFLFQLDLVKLSRKHSF